LILSKEAHNYVVVVVGGGDQGTYYATREIQAAIGGTLMGEKM
jgi:hypothetical protein